MEDRTHRILPDMHIAKIAGTYHAWRGDTGAGAYADTPGFCKAAALDEIKANGYVLTPGRYVGAAAVEADSEPFAEKMARLTATLEQQFAESARLEKVIPESLRRVGYPAESE
jgi:type I restriction enzyme M protein